MFRQHSLDQVDGQSFPTQSRTLSMTSLWCMRGDRQLCVVKVARWYWNLYNKLFGRVLDDGELVGVSGRLSKVAACLAGSATVHRQRSTIQGGVFSTPVTYRIKRRLYAFERAIQRRAPTTFARPSWRSKISPHKVSVSACVTSL